MNRYGDEAAAAATYGVWSARCPECDRLCAVHRPRGRHAAGTLWRHGKGNACPGSGRSVDPAGMVAGATWPDTGAVGAVGRELPRTCAGAA